MRRIRRLLPPPTPIYNDVIPGRAIPIDTLEKILFDNSEVPKKLDCRPPIKVHISTKLTEDNSNDVQKPSLYTPNLFDLKKDFGTFWGTQRWEAHAIRTLKACGLLHGPGETDPRPWDVPPKPPIKIILQEKQRNWTKLWSDDETAV